MKAQAPKEIQALSSEIDSKKLEIETINTDIERAQAAVAQAENLDRELDALTKKRAEQRAQAFVSRQPADMAELDSQLESLERSSRSIREDGTAAALAIVLLEAKRAEIETHTASLQERRKQAATDWLASRRERAIDRYMELIHSLGPILAEAAAADKARRNFMGVTTSHSAYGEWLLTAIKENVFPYPFTRGKQMPAGNVHPFDWLRDPQLVDRELEKVRGELAAAGFWT
jgi:chromosome segregation ATPase